MEIGVGLPTMIGGLTAKELRAWTQGAEEHRFSAPWRSSTGWSATGPSRWSR